MDKRPHQTARFEQRTSQWHGAVVRYRGPIPWLSLSLWLVCTAGYADWPQFQKDSKHSGDAVHETLEFPLKVVARIELDDAIFSSPVIQNGVVYVVDQMGTAYAINQTTSQIEWKQSPEGGAAFGGNTSTPCVIGDRLFFGTTAGNLHILNTKSGAVIRTITYDQPILDAVTFANESIYFQTLDSVVHCLDLAGNLRWEWNRNRATEAANTRRQNAHYGGVAVVVSDRSVVMSVGHDLVCVRHSANNASHLWTAKRPLGDAYVPVGMSISDEHVYASLPGKDGWGAMLRVALENGKLNETSDVLKEQWAPMAPPAVRSRSVYFSRQAFGVSAFRFGKTPERLWQSFGDTTDSHTPSLSSPVLTQNHCLFTTVTGELIAVQLTKTVNQNSKTARPPVYRFQIPSGHPISSSPAIAQGKVFFGADDGALYVLGPSKTNVASAAAISTSAQPTKVSQRKSVVKTATQRRYEWSSAFGGSRNANYINDPLLKPPLKLRWAARSGGLFKQPIVASKDDVFSASLGGLIVCREQSTGRIRWRRKLPKHAWCRSAPLYADGNLYVPRMFSLRYPKVPDRNGILFCLDVRSGSIKWQRPIGIGDRLRASPVFCDGVVAFGTLYTRENERPSRLGQVVEAWDAQTGEPLWKIDVRSSGTLLNGPAGCASDGIFCFTGGGENPRATGETIGIRPRTGEVLWRNRDEFASQTGTPSCQDGRIYLPGTYKRPLACLDAKDGSLIWRQEIGRGRWFVDTVSLADDFFAVNNKYDGGAKRWELSDGTVAISNGKPIQLWGPSHGCGSLVLTAGGYALSATKNGIYMTDSTNGKVLWKSSGFASYTCPHPIASNGRVFYCPQTSGVMYAFEPID